jgi:DNA-directed RNA polymerase subunit RPC12/RpoP
MAEKESGMKICLTCHSALKHLLTDNLYDYWICEQCGERAAVAVRVIDKEKKQNDGSDGKNKSRGKAGKRLS